jgi:trimeric autotransporter adhesin
LPNGSYNVVFNNTMRIKTNNDLFFRTPIPGVTNLQESISEIERNRLWLNITNTSGAYNETLIGYVTGATNEYDSFYDGKTIQTGNPVNMYSILGNDELAIQGRALPFNNTEIIPIGFSTTLPDTLKISLENSDGLFIELEEIYIKDNHNNTIHNIKNNPIIFTSESGTFNNRFELFFQNTLSLSNHTIPHTQIVVMQNNNDYIVYSEYKLLRSVEIYNMLGKQIAVKKGINSFQSTISSVQSEDILLFKIILEDGSFIPKKVIRQTLK